MVKYKSTKAVYKGSSYKDSCDFKYIIHCEREESLFSISEKIENLMSKIALSKIKQIIIKEMQKDYYQNGVNIKEVIDINTHLMENFVCGSDYMHVENLVIWQNGFYNFNCFNFTSSTMIKKNNNQCKYVDIAPEKFLCMKKCK